MLKILTVAIMAALTTPVGAAPIVAVGPVIIVDGDTIKVDGVKIRILEIDTPETYHSRCENELILGLKAKERLRQLVDAGQLSYAPNGLDRYGRTLAYVYVNGQSVGEVLLREQLALHYYPGPSAKAARLSHWCPTGVQ
jgi:endonuclease YncB( thermonuclease family)